MMTNQRLFYIFYIRIIAQSQKKTAVISHQTSAHLQLFLNTWLKFVSAPFVKFTVTV